MKFPPPKLSDNMAFLNSGITAMVEITGVFPHMGSMLEKAAGAGRVELWLRVGCLFVWPGKASGHEDILPMKLKVKASAAFRRILPLKPSAFVGRPLLDVAECSRAAPFAGLRQIPRVVFEKPTLVDGVVFEPRWAA